MNLYTVYQKLKGGYAQVSKSLPAGYALPPINLVIEMTYRCNLRCAMCYQRRQLAEPGVKERRNKDGELSSEQIKRLVDQTPPSCIVIFSGGEPFSRADMLDVLRYTAGKRRCHIVTNATLITPEVAAALVEAGLLSVGISIDGGEETHNRIRGMPGAYRRTVSAAKEVVRLRQEAGKRRPVVNIKTVICANNAGSLMESYEAARQCGADYCTFQIENTSPYLSALRLNEDLNLYRQPPDPVEGVDEAALSESLAALAALPPGGPQVRFLPDMSREAILDHYANRIEIRRYTCQAPWIGVNVSPFGDVFPCFNYHIGNVSVQPLLRLWNSARYRNFRRTLRREGLFAGCIGCCDLELRH
jgi:MoaA/NifB/PqqE/SkfB family radical SAM enzyme